MKKLFDTYMLAVQLIIAGFACCGLILLTGPILVAQSVTIQSSTFVAGNPPTTPNGLNDLSSGGRWSCAPLNHYFTVQTSTAGTPDQFQWSEDGGSLSSSINITGAAQTLTCGMTITFAATTGHTVSSVANNFWTIQVNGSGSTTQSSTLLPGLGAISRSAQSKLAENVNIVDYGAVCNGITDPSAMGFHDDTMAIQNALNSPLFPVIAVSPDGLPMGSGRLHFPNSASDPNGNFGCVITSTLNWSPFIQSDAPGGWTWIKAANNFAQPATGGPFTITNATWSSSVSTYTIASTATLQVGMQVSITGTVTTGSTLFAGFNTSNYVTIASIPNSTTFTTAQPFGNPGTYVSGGRLVAGFNQWMINIINGNGNAFGNADNNFTVDWSGIHLLANSAGDEFTSGINGNASTNSQFAKIDINVPNIAIVLGGIGTNGINNAADNLSGDRIKIAPPLFMDGPCSQGLVFAGNIPGAGPIALRNIKITSQGLPNGSNGTNWCFGTTPSVDIPQGAAGISIDAISIEQGSFIHVGAITHDIHITGLSYGVDVCGPPSPFTPADYPLAVLLEYGGFTPDFQNVYVGGEFINAAVGTYLQTVFGTMNINPGFSACTANADDYRQNRIQIEGSSVYLNGRLLQLAGTLPTPTSGYGNATSLTYNGPYTWFTPSGAAGAMLFTTQPGSANANTNKGYEIDSCTSGAPGVVGEVTYDGFQCAEAITTVSWAGGSLTYTLACGTCIGNPTADMYVGAIVSTVGMLPSGCNVSSVPVTGVPSGTTISVSVAINPTPCTGLPAVLTPPNHRYVSYTLGSGVSLGDPAPGTNTQVTVNGSLQINNGNVVQNNSTGSAAYTYIITPGGGAGWVAQESGGGNRAQDVISAGNSFKDYYGTFHIRNGFGGTDVINMDTMGSIDFPLLGLGLAHLSSSGVLTSSAVIAADIAATGVSAGTYQSVTVNTKGQVTGATSPGLTHTTTLPCAGTMVFINGLLTTVTGSC